MMRHPERFLVSFSASHVNLGTALVQLQQFADAEQQFPQAL